MPARTNIQKMAGRGGRGPGRVAGRGGGGRGNNNNANFGGRGGGRGGRGRGGRGAGKGGRGNDKKPAKPVDLDEGLDECEQAASSLFLALLGRAGRKGPASEAGHPALRVHRRLSFFDVCLEGRRGSQKEEANPYIG